MKMLHSFRRAAAVIAVAVSTMVVPAFASHAGPVAAAGLSNCVTAVRHVACWEYVWVDGEQRRLTFAQAGDPMSPIPSAKTQPFYVVAPQSDTPQGDVPAFVHDHTIAAAPASPGWTPLMHGYYVICSPEGISTGTCEYSLRTIPGGTIPLAVSVNGEPLTSATTIEAGIDAGLLIPIDTGAVLVGTITGHS
jgi:hypothetical protein